MDGTVGGKPPWTFRKHDGIALFFGIVPNDPLLQCMCQGVSHSLHTIRKGQRQSNHGLIVPVELPIHTWEG